MLRALQNRGKPGFFIPSHACFPGNLGKFNTLSKVTGQCLRYCIAAFQSTSSLWMSQSIWGFGFFVFKQALHWVSVGDERGNQIFNCVWIFQRWKWWDGQNYWQVRVLVLETRNGDHLFLRIFIMANRSFWVLLFEDGSLSAWELKVWPKIRLWPNTDVPCQLKEEDEIWSVA